MKVVSQLEKASLENLTTAQEPAAGTTGRTWYNTDTSRTRVDNGGSIDDVGAGLSVPTGVMLDFAGAEGSIPGGFLICDGASHTTAAEAALFAVIGYVYGGAGPNFNVPDFRGRAVIGKDDMGGGAAGRVTVGESGIAGDTLGASGGVETHALSEAELAAHDHALSAVPTNSDGAHSHPNILGGGGGTYADLSALGIGTPGPRVIAERGGPGAALATTSDGAHTHTVTGSTDNAGSGDTHQNMPPSGVANKIIKT